MDRETERILASPLGGELSARHALRRIVSDLRLASVRGEDRNGNGVLEADEDGNENGYLDADWTLADGAVDQPSIAFNLRTDEYDEAGNLTVSGVFTPPIRYLVQDGRLVRERVVDLAGGGTTTQRVVLAKDVSAARFSRAGRVVTIGLDLVVPRGAYGTGTRTISTRVFLAN